MGHDSAGCSLGGRNLALEWHHLRRLLGHRARAVQRERRALSRWEMGVKPTLLSRWASWRGRCVAVWAVVRQPQICVVLVCWDVEWEPLDTLPGNLVVLMVDGCALVGVHRGNRRVILIRNEIILVRNISCPLQHLHPRVLLGMELRLAKSGRPVELGHSVRRYAGSVAVVLLRHGIGTHLLAKVGKGTRPLSLVAGVMAHHGWRVWLPRHGGMTLGRGRRAVTSTVGDQVIGPSGMIASLVCSFEVFDHGRFPTEAAREG